MRRISSAMLCACSVGLVCAPAGFAQAPLHERIDQLVAAKPDYAKQAAAVASDAELLRRATLDLSGAIPTGAEARAFFNDKTPDKRAKLIDRLLASSGYARHMTNVF